MCDCVIRACQPVRIGDVSLPFAVYERTPIGSVLLALCFTHDQAETFVSLLPNDGFNHERLHPLRPRLRRKARRNRPQPN